MEQILKKSHLLGTIKTTLLAVLVMLFIFLGIKSAFGVTINTWALFNSNWTGTDATYTISGSFTGYAAPLSLSARKSGAGLATTITATAYRTIGGGSMAGPGLNYNSNLVSVIQNVAFQNFTNTLTSENGGAIAINVGTLTFSNTVTTLMEFKGNKHNGKANDVTITGGIVHLSSTVITSSIAFRSGIKATGGTLNLTENRGTLILGGLINISNVAGLNINKTNAILKIENATGTFMKGSGQRIVFNGGTGITGHHLVILNSSITFYNSTNNPGQGIFIDDESHRSTHTITNSYVRLDNSMQPNFAGQYGGLAFRGASYNTDSQNWFKVVTSTIVFHGNRAATGGAMLLSSNNTFFTLNSMVIFSSNTTTGDLGGAVNSEHGGRVWFYGGTIEFTGNKSGSGETGGAIGMKGSFVVVEANKLFYMHDNYSGTYGGAIDLANKGATTKLTGSSMSFIKTNAVISSNSTSQHGGGIAVRGGGSQLWFVGGKVVISGNVGAGAGYGGGLYVGRGGDTAGGTNTDRATLLGGAIVDFNYNTLPQTGGAGAYFGETAVVAVTASTMTFTGNNAYLEGGGMLIASNANVTFTNSYLRFFKNKTQMHGGGISLTGSFANGEFDSATVLNISGGKIFFETNVSGTGYGGGIYIENSANTPLKTLTVTNAAILTFAENTLTGGERVGDFKA